MRSSGRSRELFQHWSAENGVRQARRSLEFPRGILEWRLTSCSIGRKGLRGGLMARGDPSERNVTHGHDIAKSEDPRILTFLRLFEIKTRRNCQPPFPPCGSWGAMINGKKSVRRLVTRFQFVMLEPNMAPDCKGSSLSCRPERTFPIIESDEADIFQECELAQSCQKSRGHLLRPLSDRGRQRESDCTRHGGSRSPVLLRFVAGSYHPKPVRLSPARAV